jgi:hypothetical protein
MIVHITCEDALKMVDKANAAGVVQNFVQLENPSGGPDELVLQWNPDTATNPLRIVLGKDGTWRATLDITAPGE